MKNKTVFKDNKIHTLNHRITHTVSNQVSLGKQRSKKTSAIAIIRRKISQQK